MTEWRYLPVTAVYINEAGKLVILGDPDLVPGHNCDQMGCGSLDHVIFRTDVPEYWLNSELV